MIICGNGVQWRLQLNAVETSEGGQARASPCMEMGSPLPPLAFTGFVELRTVLKRNVSALQDALLGLL